MRVLFDAYWWATGPISNRSVLREFVLSWVKRYPEDDVAVAVPYSAIPLARLELEGLASVTGTRLSPHGLSNILELPIIAKRFRADITVAHNFSPFLGRSAVFIHDFIFKSNPEWFTFKERAYFALMPLSSPRASLVLTSTRSEALRVQTYGHLKARPTAIGLGLGGHLLSATATRPPSLPQLTGFVVSVGRLNVRKNIAKTIEAAIVSGSLTRDRPLIVVGEASGRGMSISPEIQLAMDEGKVLFMGRVDDAELKWLYQNAQLFVFLTLDEGFGMPILESLSLGTPMIVSDIPVFREILGNAATFVDPTDRDAISTALNRALEHPLPSEDGSEILEYFTWDGAVDRMRDAISTHIGITQTLRVKS
jgi:glycosyltransferase involved in cell wall biosynthesis